MFVACLSGEKEDAVEPRIKDTPRDLIVDAGLDTVVTLLDTVRLHARVPQRDAEVRSWEWQPAGASGFRPLPSGTIAFTAGSESGRFPYIFKVTDSLGRTALDTVFVTVLRDQPRIHAGKDTLVSISDTVRVRVLASDSLGRIVRIESDLGRRGRFVPIPADTFFVARGDFGFDTCIVRAIDDDGLVSEDTLVAKVIDDFPKTKLGFSENPAQEGGGVRFSVQAIDAGHIVKWEWDLGQGILVPGPKDTVFLTRSPDGTVVRIRSRITDDDGNTALDSLPFVVSHWQSLALADSAALRPSGSARYRATSYAGRFYIYPAPDLGIFENVTYSYDPKTGRWEREAPLPDGLSGSSLTEAGGALFALGGQFKESEGKPGRVYEYIPGLREWFPRHDLPGDGYGAKAVAYGADLYAASLSGSRLVAQSRWDPALNVEGLALDRYDRKTDTWVRESVMPFQDVALSGGASAPWALLGGVEVGDTLWFMMRRSEETRPFRYLPATGEWKPGRVLYEGNAPTGLASLGGLVYLMGSSGSASRLQVYDPVADDWDNRTGSRHPTAFASPVALDGKLYNLADDDQLQYFEP